MRYADLSDKREPTPGYRYFLCDHCGHEWLDYCRDRDTPSGDSCPECGEWVHWPEPATDGQVHRLTRK